MKKTQRINDTFKNKSPLTKKQVEKAKFGNVFIVSDREFNPKANKEKTRRVVYLGLKNGSLIVAPVKHTSIARMELKNFDGNRSVYLDKQRYISKNKVFKKNQFKGTNNDYLTISEKHVLRKKFNAYKKT